MSRDRTILQWPESILHANPFKADGRMKLWLNTCLVSSHKQQVRGVDGTGQDTNAHFPLPRFWERTLLNRQHLGRLPILLEANRFHLSPLLSSAKSCL